MDFAQSDPTSYSLHLALICANTSKEGQKGEGGWKEGVGRQTDRQFLAVVEHGNGGLPVITLFSQLCFLCIL